MFDKSIPTAVRQDVLSPAGVVSASAMRPGMSGGLVFKCQLASGDCLALKRLPAGMQFSRIQEIHRVLECSRRNGMELVPALHAAGGPARTAYSHQGIFWELSQWMPGIPAAHVIAHEQTTLEQVGRGAGVIARFQASVVGMGLDNRPPPAVGSRLKRLRALEPLIGETLDLAARPAFLEPISGDLQEPIQQACCLLRWKWNEVRSRISRSLSQYVDRSVPVQYVLRDVHRDHILFNQRREATGLIDFDAVRMDTQATDLARWVGSFSVGAGRGAGEDQDLLWEAALAGFHRENALKKGRRTELDENLARHLCFATTWLSLANWLVWILLQNRVFPAEPSILGERITELTEKAIQGL